MYNPQFNGERNSYLDIEKRLTMEIVDTTDHGPPDDDANLIQLLIDARAYIAQAKLIFSIPDDWAVMEEE